MKRSIMAALVGLAVLGVAGLVSMYLSSRGISVYIGSGPKEGSFVIEGGAEMPPELAAALKEAMRKAEAGEVGEGTSIELDSESQAAFLRFAEQGQAKAEASRRGKRFPVEQLQTLDGQPIDLGESRTLINFWATWCAPCIAEMPLLEALAAEGEYQVITINNDFDRGELDDWLAENALSLPVHYDAGNALAAEFGVRSWPTSLVLDEQGVVLHGFSAAPSELAALKAMLRAY